MVWKYILSAVIGYLIGCVSFGYIGGKIFKGKDIRDVGSGNPGTANAIRNYGWGIGVFTFLGDVLKGILAAYIGLSLFGEAGGFFQAASGSTLWIGGGFGELIYNWSIIKLPAQAQMGAYIGGLFAVIGHIWPVFLKFKGGKGVATTFGVFLVMMPFLTLIGFAISVVIIALTKTMSIGSLAGTTIMTAASIVFYSGNWWHHATCVILLILVLYSHRANLKRLAEGKENQL